MQQGADRGGPPYRPPFTSSVAKLTWALQQHYEGMNPNGSLKANVCFMCGGSDHRGFARADGVGSPGCTDPRWRRGVWQRS